MAAKLSRTAYLRASLMLVAVVIVLVVVVETLAYGEQASWYGSELAGSQTASGAPYDPSGLTAASPSLPFGTRLLVSHKGSDGLKRSTVVTVNDRGPYAGGRTLDLSESAASAIGLKDEGAGEVEVTELDSSPGDGGTLPETGGVNFG